MSGYKVVAAEETAAQLLLISEEQLRGELSFEQWEAEMRDIMSQCEVLGIVGDVIVIEQRKMSAAVSSMTIKK